MKLKIILADDHIDFRSRFRQIVENDENLQVIAEAENGNLAIQLAEELNPDLIFMDIMMPVMDGIEASKKILERNPNVKIIILTIHTSKNYRERAKEAGVSGYLLKNKANREVMKAIETVMSGGYYS